MMACCSFNPTTTKAAWTGRDQAHMVGCICIIFSRLQCALARRARSATTAFLLFRWTFRYVPYIYIHICITCTIHYTSVYIQSAVQHTLYNLFGQQLPEPCGRSRSRSPFDRHSIALIFWILMISFSKIRPCIVYTFAYSGSTVPRPMLLLLLRCCVGACNFWHRCFRFIQSVSARMFIGRTFRFAYANRIVLFAHHKTRLSHEFTSHNCNTQQTATATTTTKHYLLPLYIVYFEQQRVNHGRAIAR